MKPWLARGSVLILVAIFGWIVAGLIVSDSPRPATAGMTVAVPRMADATIVTRYEDNSQVFALLWTGDTLWHVRSASDGQQTLAKYTPDGRVQSWGIPGKAPQTPHTFLEVTEDGGIWIAAGYRLAVFDPGQEKFLNSWTLPLDDPNADKEALSPQSPLPGTWLNGLMSTGREVLFTRQNVTATFAASLDGVVVSEILSFAPSGLVRSGGLPRPYIRENDRLRLPAFDGKLADSRGIGRTEIEGCSLEAYPGEGILRLSSRLAGTSELRIQPHPQDRFAGNGTVLAVGSVATGAIVRANCQTGTIESLALPRRTGIAIDGPNPPDGIVYPDEEVIIPWAVAVSDDGVLAYSASDSSVVIVR